MKRLVSAVILAIFFIVCAGIAAAEEDFTKWPTSGLFDKILAHYDALIEIIKTNKNDLARANAVLEEYFTKYQPEIDNIMAAIEPRVETEGQALAAYAEKLAEKAQILAQYMQEMMDIQKGAAGATR